MGKRLHVIKKHAVYGNGEYFNWTFEEFRSFIDGIGSNTCGEEYADDFECEVDDYKKALNIVKYYKKHGWTKKFEAMLDEVGSYYDDEESFNESVEGLGGLDYVLEAMQTFYDERDKKYRWISFSAW